MNTPKERPAPPDITQNETDETTSLHPSEVSSTPEIPETEGLSDDDEPFSLDPREFFFSGPIPNLEGLSDEEVDDLAVKSLDDRFIFIKAMARDMDWDSLTFMIRCYREQAWTIWDGGHSIVAMKLLVGLIGLLENRGEDLQLGHAGQKSPIRTSSFEMANAAAIAMFSAVR